MGLILQSSFWKNCSLVTKIFTYIHSGRLLIKCLWPWTERADVHANAKLPFLLRKPCNANGQLESCLLHSAASMDLMSSFSSSAAPAAVPPQAGFACQLDASTPQKPSWALSCLSSDCCEVIQVIQMYHQGAPGHHPRPLASASDFAAVLSLSGHIKRCLSCLPDHAVEERRHVYESK